MMNRMLQPVLLLSAFMASTAVLGQGVQQRIVDVTRQDAEFRPAEVSVAINPTDPDNLIGVSMTAARQSGIYVSQDGGATWEAQGAANPDDRVHSDPFIAFDAEGVAYRSYLAFVGAFLVDPERQANGLFLSSSINGGLSWSDPVAIIDHPDSIAPFEDRSALAIDSDAESDFANRIYLAWSRFDALNQSNGCASQILLVRSEDRGASFSEPVSVSDRGGDCLDDDGSVTGPSPAIGPNGEVYVSWAGPLGIIFDKSMDGGVTFGTDQVISDNPGGWNLPVPGRIRHNGLPVTGVDRSDGPMRGSIYVSWIDSRNGDLDVFVAHSRDGGETWSEPMRVNDDPVGNGKNQLFAWMAVDPGDGSVNLIFYDQRDLVGDDLRLTLARSTDGGRLFRNYQIEQAPFDCHPNLFLGDFIGIDALDGQISAVYTHCPSTTRLNLRAANFEFELGEGGAPRPLVQLDDSDSFPVDDSVLFDFEAFSSRSPAADLLSDWGIRFPAAVDFSASISSQPGAEPDSPSDNVLTLRPADGGAFRSPVVIDFRFPMRRVGFDRETESGSSISAFDSTGSLLGTVESGPGGGFFGVQTEREPGISKLVIDFGTSGLQALDDLRIEYMEAPVFRSCVAQVGSGPAQDLRLATEIVLANLGPFPARTRLELFDSDGNPLTLGINGAQGSLFEEEAAAFEAIRYVTDSDSVGVGYGCLQSSAPFLATALFRQSDAQGALIGEAGVGASAGSLLSIGAVERDPQSGSDTALAIANTSEESIDVEIRLIGESVGAIPSLRMVLRPREHFARFLGELFPDLGEAAVQATIQIASEGPLAATILRTSGGRIVSSLPVGSSEN